MEIGKLNTLMASRQTDNGLYLIDSQGVEVLLPNRYVPADWAEGMPLEVFVHTDSEDRLVATTDTPHVMADGLAKLTVVSANRIGAFVDWGLSKDLLVPHSNQFHPLKVGDTPLIYAYLDPVTSRVVGTQKLGKFISNDEISVSVGEKVEIIATQRKEIGYRVVINARHWGLIYFNEIFGEVRLGEPMEGWISRITPDSRIDVSLQQRGFDQVKVAATALLELLEECCGVLEIGDKSDSAEIQLLCGMSKKNFKRAVGHLLSQGLVEVSPNSVKLTKK